MTDSLPDSTALMPADTASDQELAESAAASVHIARNCLSDTRFVLLDLRADSEYRFNAASQLSLATAALYADFEYLDRIYQQMEKLVSSVEQLMRICSLPAGSDHTCVSAPGGDTA